MRKSLLRSLVASMGAVALGAAVMLLAPLTAVGQAPAAATKSKAKTYTPPRTPDGKPDLQGYWTNATTTPLERPKGLGAKEFYTEQEMADNEKREHDRATQALLGRDTEPGSTDDVHYDFSQYGLDRGQSKVAWNRRTSLIVGATGTLPPMLPEARKRGADIAAKNRGHEFDGPENRPLSARCIILGQESVPMLPGGYNNDFQIVQGEGYVVIMHEMNHATRVIPTDASPHPSPSVHQYRGDSRGHWEGNTLVVDTTNFSSASPFRGSSDKMHVVERFNRVDPDTILYQFTVNDPLTWDTPWSGEVAITKADGPIYEFGCHEGNYGLANTLNGARVAEADAAAAKNAK